MELNFLLRFNLFIELSLISQNDACIKLLLFNDDNISNESVPV